VALLVFKTSVLAPEGAAGGFDPHTLPPFEMMQTDRVGLAGRLTYAPRESARALPDQEGQEKKKEGVPMKRSILTLALAGIFTLGLTVRAEEAKPKPKTVSETTSVKVTVLDVNKAKKEVTVKDESGDVSVVEVPRHFTLEKVKVGDVVTLTYA
jgi:hypothetical protein